MTAVKLDRTRSYGSVHGEETGGAFFEQDGILFDNEGLALANQPSPNIQKLVADRERLMRANQAAKEAFEAAMAGQPVGDAPAGAAPVIVSEDAPPPAPGLDGPTVDLRGWMTGTARYQWFEISSALLKQHGFKAQNKEQAVNFLIEELKLQPEDVKIA